MERDDQRAFENTTMPNVVGAQCDPVGSGAQLGKAQLANRTSAVDHIARCGTLA